MHRDTQVAWFEVILSRVVAFFRKMKAALLKSIQEQKFFNILTCELPVKIRTNHCRKFTLFLPINKTVICPRLEVQTQKRKKKKREKDLFSFS